MSPQVLNCLQLKVSHTVKWDILGASSEALQQEKLVYYLRSFQQKFHFCSNFLVSLFIQVISTSWGYV